MLSLNKILKVLRFQRIALVACLLGLTFGTDLDVKADSSSTNTILLKETVAQHNARMEWWREARFGMFIHWGLYSEAAGYWGGKPTSGAGEWIMNDMKIPLSQYAKLVPKFNPQKFNADTWVKIAKTQA